MKPTGPLRLSNSKANTFRRCQKQYEFKYGYQLKPKRVKLHLKLGDWVHQLLMVHYDGHDWRERHAVLAKEFDQLFDEEKEELGDLPTDASRIFRGYLAHYREEDKLYRVVDTEINETIDLPNGMKMQIIIDMVVEEIADGGLWIWDHKNVSRFFPEDFLLLDAQLALYFWGADKRLGYHNLHGALLNELITKPPTLPKFTKTGKRLEMRKNLHCDGYTYYGEIKKHGLDPKDYKDFLQFLRSRHDEWWRRTRLPRDEDMVNTVIAEMMATGEDIQTVTERDIFTRTSRKECQYDCDFRDLCIAQLQGADISDMVKLGFVKNLKPDDDDVAKIWPHAIKLKKG